MKNTRLILASTLLVLTGTTLAHAQTATSPDMKPTTSSYRAKDEYGARAGELEFTLGGSGSSNKDLDNSLGGVNFSVGYFMSDTLEIVGRQSASYANGPGGGGADYNGSTFVALDQHFGSSRLRPFVGINFGGLYGDNTSDTWAAGLEAGLKFYVHPQTFVFGLANYEWTFKNSGDATDNFDNGAFLWTLGVGFNL
jgi:hypothetical protein